MILKPCPFCDSPVKTRTYLTESLWSHNQAEYLQIECPEDCAMMSGEDHEEVVKRWNRRDGMSLSKEDTELLNWLKGE